MYTFDLSRLLNFCSFYFIIYDRNDGSSLQYDDDVEFKYLREAGDWRRKEKQHSSAVIF